MVLVPVLKLIGALAAPEVTLTPLTLTNAAGSDAVGVTVRALVVLDTLAV
jgi:hypothetical protein